MMRALTVIVLVFVGAPAWAQRLELAPIVSYTTPATIDQTADGVDDLEISGAMTWGARGSYLVTNRIAVEGLWTYQPTHVMMTSGGSKAELFDMSVNQVFGNVVYQLGSSLARLQPFAFGGLGATFFEATDVDGETKLAWDVGAGVKWFVNHRFGVEGRVRYKPTQLHENGTCGPFDFCQGALHSVGLSTAFLTRF
jgi:hypothetical protein